MTKWYERAGMKYRTTLIVAALFCSTAAAAEEAVTCDARGVSIMMMLTMRAGRQSRGARAIEYAQFAARIRTKVTRLISWNICLTDA